MGKHGRHHGDCGRGDQGGCKCGCECGCGRGHCDCDRKHVSDTCACGEHNDSSCQCGQGEHDTCECAGGHATHGQRFERRFISRAERAAELEAYLGQLRSEIDAGEAYLKDIRAEAQAVEERITALKVE